MDLKLQFRVFCICKPHKTGWFTDLDGKFILSPVQIHDHSCETSDTPTSAFSRITATLKKLRKRFKGNIDSPEKEEFKPFIKTFVETKKPSNLNYVIIELLLQLKVKNQELLRQNGTKIAPWKKEKLIGKSFSVDKKMHKRYQTYNFPILMFSIDGYHQIHFYIKLQLKIMITAPFVEKKQKLCSTFSEIAILLLSFGKAFLNGYNHAH